MDILISEDLQPPAIDRLAESFSIVREPKLWADHVRLQSELSRARTILVRNQTQVTAALLETALDLVGIGRVGVGLDNIDVPAASRLGIAVVAPLNANAVSVAELTLGLILALARKLPAADASTKAGGWDRKGCTGIELEGKTLGICGFGRIGRLVASRARAFGMRVLAFDPVLDHGAAAPGESARFTDLENLLADADFVTLHLPLTPETKHLFDTRRCAAMKRGSFFINTSRGGVVDESALSQALSDQRLAGAALAVRAVEPPDILSSYTAIPFQRRPRQ